MCITQTQEKKILDYCYVYSVYRIHELFSHCKFEPFTIIFVQDIQYDEAYAAFDFPLNCVLVHS